MFKKKLVALIIAVMMILGSTMAARAADYTYFPDVPDDAEYAYAVNLLYQLGIFVGDDNGHYNPDSTITRAEFATLICRIVGVESEAKSIIVSSFSDVPSSHWACGYVSKAAQMGYIEGYGNGKFGPSDTLKYEQAIKLLVCALGLGDVAQAEGGYPDGYLAVAADIGLADGLGTTGEDIPRSLVAVLVYNAVTMEVGE